MKPKLSVSILLASTVFMTAACSREDRPPPAAPAAPVPSDPARTPAPSANVPPLPDPKAPDGPPGRDSKASNPQGELTRREESTAMPKPGQANNHSSPAFDSSQDARSK